MNLNSSNKPSQKFISPISRSEYIFPAVITLSLLTASFLLHYFCESTMAQSDDMWEYRLKVHLTGYPFSLRHFTSQTIEFMSRFLGLSIKESFFTIHFLLAVLLGPFFFRFLRKMSFDKSSANIGVVLLLTAYPIMSAHFEPVFTWDDFWLYLFSVISFSFALGRNFAWSGIFFAIGCVAREQLVLLFPAYSLTIFLLSPKESSIKRMIYIFFPLIIWGSYYLNFVQKGDPNRLKYLMLNFEDFQWGRDSVFSMFISFGFLWMVSILAWFRLIEKKRNRIANILFWGFLLTLPVNTIFTLAMTFAREIRIFFPPFIFVIPLSLIMITASIKYWRTMESKLRKFISIVVLTSSILAGYLIIEGLIFPEFRYRQCWNFCQIWAGINIALSFVIFLLYLLSTRFRNIYAELEKRTLLKQS